MKLIPLLMIVTMWFVPSSQAPTVADKNAPSKITIATKDEPGERLVVSGVVFGSDGKTPLSDASVYVFHTDAKGLYTPGTNDNRNPRLRGYMRTDSHGRYEYSTIRPASYPDTRVVAHIHYVVSTPGYKERVFEIVFEGDPFVDDRARAESTKEGSGLSIRPLTGDRQSGWRCTQDVTLSK